MNKKAIGTIGMLILVAGSVGIAAPANAAAQDSYCPSGATCTWGDRYYLTGGSPSTRVAFYQYIKDYSTLNYPGTARSANDSATSIYNHGVSESSHMYQDAYKSRLLLDLPRGAGFDQLNVQRSFANDQISSGYYDSFN